LQSQVSLTLSRTFFFDIKAARPLPTYGIPGNIDRL